MGSDITLICRKLRTEVRSTVSLMQKIRSRVPFYAPFCACHKANIPIHEEGGWVICYELPKIKLNAFKGIILQQATFFLSLLVFIYIIK